jgi:hypothetical protein
MDERTKEEFYDNMFMNMVTKLDGGVYEFLDLVLGFLRRRTGAFGIIQQHFRKMSTNSDFR